jgi:phage terminase Nu1 subunit (DNA packaging protein)
MNQENLTQKEAADRLGISPRRLRHLSKRGDLTRLRDGAYPWPLIREEHRELREAADRKRGRAPSGSGLSEARTRKENARARLAELEAAEKEGLLLPTSIVQEVLGSALDRLRQRILTIPGTWPPRLAPLEDSRAVQKELKELTDELLQSLASVADDIEAEARK